MSDLKSFLVPPPNGPGSNRPGSSDDPKLERSLTQAQVSFGPEICLSDEDLEALRGATLPDSIRLIDHYDPIPKEHQATLKLQVKAIEKIAQHAKEQANSSNKLSKAANDIAISAQNHAKNSNQIAESAKDLSKLADRKANKADVKSWIAIAISLIALVVEIISNWNAISLFFQAFI